MARTISSNRSASEAPLARLRRLEEALERVPNHGAQHARLAAAIHAEAAVYRKALDVEQAAAERTRAEASEPRIERRIARSATRVRS